MTKQDWKEHNRGFLHDPPEKEPEAWSQDEYHELYDRVIGNGPEGRPWYCEKCSKPFTSLEHARSHVGSQHREKLIESAVRNQQ